MHFSSRILSLLTAFLLAAGLVLPAGAADSNPFKKANPPREFADVNGTDWFYKDVGSVYEFGMMVGKTETSFDPYGTVTYAEAVTIAARLHSMAETGGYSFARSDPWYRTCLDYCQSRGIGPLTGLNADDEAVRKKMGEAAVRADFARFVSDALPDSVLNAVNTVEAGAVPDVDARADDVYRLYRAGIITGVDDRGSFHPDQNITRCEVAAILARVADPALRKTVTLRAPVPLTEEAVRSTAARESGGTVAFVSLGDFDGDGRSEAFAVTVTDPADAQDGKTFADATVWFMTAHGAEAIVSGAPYVMLGSPDYRWDDWGRLKIFRYNGLYNWTTLWKVENGKAVCFSLPDYKDVIDIPGYTPTFSQMTVMLDKERNGYLVYTKTYGGADDPFGGHPETRYAFRLYQLNPDTLEFEWTMVKTSAKSDWVKIDPSAKGYDAESLMGGLFIFDLDD